MDAEDLMQVFLPHQAARLISGAKDPAMVETLLSDALEVALIAATAYATTGYTSHPFPPSEEIQGGFGMVDNTTRRVAKELWEAAARGDSPSQIHALQANLLRKVDKANLQIHRRELARWIQDNGITSAYQFDQQQSPAAAPAVRLHSTKTAQRDEADVFIDAALAAVGQDADVATVWSWLNKVANSKGDKPGTLMEGGEDGLKYLKGTTVTFLPRDALSKRLKRRRTP